MVAGAQKGSRLGRGLASLIGEPAAVQQRVPDEGEQQVVAIDRVEPSPLNPRKIFNEDELSELATSISQRGLVQPLIVRPAQLHSGADFEIVAGERRWRAAQKAGLHTLPVIVRSLSDQQVLELAIIENVQRSDLNAIEEARGYSELIEKFSYGQEELAQIIGKSRSHLANMMRLLKLPGTVQKLVQDGRLSAGHARALIGHEDAERFAMEIIERGLNVREAEGLVQRSALAPAEPRRPREKDADTRAFEQELSEALGLKVELKPTSGESGTLSIKYGNFDQLDYVRQRLLGTDH